MKHYNLKPIRLVLRPSRRLAWVLALAGTGACGLVLLMPLPWWSKLLWCAIALPATCFHVLRDGLLRLANSITVIEVDVHGRLHCQTRNGAWVDAEVLDDSYVTPWLTVLRLRLPQRRWAKHALLLSDSGDAEMFRRLRVWLRWGRQGTG